MLSLANILTHWKGIDVPMTNWLVLSVLMGVLSQAAFGACVGDYSLPGEYKWSEAAIRA
jgi:hypothetical protein